MDHLEITEIKVAGRNVTVSKAIDFMTVLSWVAMILYACHALAVCETPWLQQSTRVISELILSWMDSERRWRLLIICSWNFRYS